MIPDRLEPTQGPCACLVALDQYPHTIAEHDRTWRGGWTWDPPCGGCFECVCQQIRYYERIAS